MNDLRRIRGMKPQALRQSGQSILEHVAEGKATQPEDYPERPAGPLPKKVQPCVEAIKVFCRKRARELGLLPELVPPKPWTGPLLRSWLASGTFTRPQKAEGWRTDQVLTPLLEHLNQQNFERPQ